MSVYHLDILLLPYHLREFQVGKQIVLKRTFVTQIEAEIKGLSSKIIYEQPLILLKNRRFSLILIGRDMGVSTTPLSHLKWHTFRKLLNEMVRSRRLTGYPNYFTDLPQMNLLQNGKSQKCVRHEDTQTCDAVLVRTSAKKPAQVSEERQ